jgi:hypothetical protein
MSVEVQRHGDDRGDRHRDHGGEAMMLTAPRRSSCTARRCTSVQSPFLAYNTSLSEQIEYAAEIEALHA